MLANGKRNKEVAQGLNLNEKTVSTYKARLMKKLNVDNMVDLLQQAKFRMLVLRGTKPKKIVSNTSQILK